MNEIYKIFGLNENEIKVYKALLKLKKGTKTPIVKESGVLSSKVYEILDRLIRKGLVSTFTENSVKNYVPVPASSIKILLDEKIEYMNEQKKSFEKNINNLFPQNVDYLTDVQLYRGWNGLKNVFHILAGDLKKGDTYHILGVNPGEDIDKSIEFFSKTDQLFFSKDIKIKAIGHNKRKKESESFLKTFGRKNFEIRYCDLVGPFEIGITNNLVVLLLLEKNPTAFLINNKKIRDSFYDYFNTIWKISKK
ncbi:hypothetical protein COU57_04745 [Candidatus Pacearchaeota archaeon CG10_big_fil_rev_8_21_14_0_10_32_14]|nr:MAG: hypothetical protein COU57_04745 [Candidatus Pacearchaeota archaeon CG10_big_fil_rev_8_21_14_0_10_32_14]